METFSRRGVWHFSNSRPERVNNCNGKANILKIKINAKDNELI